MFEGLRFAHWKPEIDAEGIAVLTLGRAGLVEPSGRAPGQGRRLAPGAVPGPAEHRIDVSGSQHGLAGPGQARGGHPVRQAARVSRLVSGDTGTASSEINFLLNGRITICFAAAAPSRDRRARPHRSSSQLASNPNCQKSLALVGAPNAANLPCSLRASRE